MSRRARVTPADAGLPDGGARRRTPGLRREEVAVLAGVGVSWYQWLEQGRDITVSGQVLDSVSRVLKLDEPERRHLYVLAGLNPPLLAIPQEQATVSDSIQRLIDAWMPLPANVIDRYWNNVAFNAASAAVFDFSDRCTNCLVNYFTSHIYRGRHVGWSEDAALIAAEYRAAAAEFPGDEGFAAIVDDLSLQSEHFAELWARGDVRPPGTRPKHVDHPLVGELHFESTQLRIPERPDLTVVLHNALPGTETLQKLQWLASPESRRATMRPIAG
ncbi:helix-turn-helix transcriptional regulator [Streptacidiphilus jiangxiensis]|uniref:Helix-turn-helix domain-containing protein n=1 Tax=Streptacidiphilus jiangxiensis TaxID=235985 RepID=A0A1H7SAH0_STRJI|nr:helix-turn-helix transcriptional regulator [Streptacidiphilus jiangxiensis]SEL69610.1 Helix-turn-helix domain-containing protein [Streptacidiphilus jiangxiensis]